MILTKEVKIFMIGSIIKYYKNLGYQAKHGEEINIKIENLSHSSNALILAKCDNCETKVEMKYQTYVRIFKNMNLYCCCKCKGYKIKNTCLKKYGVENVSNTTDVKNKRFLKIKSTMQKTKESKIKSGWQVKDEDSNNGMDMIIMITST